jgi:hypothetical protein
MTRNELIEALDAEIARLERARAILQSDSVNNGLLPATRRGLPAKAGKRTMSAEGRARIAAAQKARWAKTKRAGK